LGYGVGHTSPFIPSRLDQYPPRIRDFLENGVKAYLQRQYVIHDIYKLQVQPYINSQIAPQIWSQIDDVVSHIVIYMELLPDGTIRYGYDAIDID
jgi:hypothetical protein